MNNLKETKVSMVKKEMEINQAMVEEVTEDVEVTEVEEEVRAEEDIIIRSQKLLRNKELTILHEIIQ